MTCNNHFDQIPHTLCTMVYETLWLVISLWNIHAYTTYVDSHSVKWRECSDIGTAIRQHCLSLQFSTSDCLNLLCDLQKLMYCAVVILYEVYSQLSLRVTIIWFCVNLWTTGKQYNTYTTVHPIVIFFLLLVRFISKKGGEGEIMGIMWLCHMMLSHEERVIQIIFVFTS